jgi:hypothetical protein
VPIMRGLTETCWIHKQVRLWWTVNAHLVKSQETGWVAKIWILVRVMGVFSLLLHWNRTCGLPCLSNAYWWSYQVKVATDCSFGRQPTVLTHHIPWWWRKWRSLKRWTSAPNWCSWLPERILS